RLLGARRLLCHLSGAPPLGPAARPRLRRRVAGDGAKQRGLAGTAAPDKAGLGPGREGERGMVEQQAPGNPQRKVVYDQHGRAFWPAGTPKARPKAWAKRSGVGPALFRALEIDDVQHHRLPPEHRQDRVRLSAMVGLVVEE